MKVSLSDAIKLLLEIEQISQTKALTAVVDTHDDKTGKNDHEVVVRASLVPKGTRPAWLTSPD